MDSYPVRRIDLIVIPLIACWFCMLSGKMRWPGGLSVNWLISMVLCMVGFILNCRFKRTARLDGVLAGISLSLLFLAFFGLGAVYNDYRLMREGAGDERVGIQARFGNGATPNRTTGKLHAGYVTIVIPFENTSIAHERTFANFVFGHIHYVQNDD